MESEINFRSGNNQLAGIVVVPASTNPCPAVILVHGSGPADRDSNGAFIALREYFASRGYAALCYDKPGVGRSTGDWTQQSFEDRAHEVVAALRLLQAYPAIDTRYVGLCGASQAGWIMPIVAQQANEIAFIISISGPAVVTHEQEAYRIESQLRVDEFTEEQIEHALAIYSRRLEMIRQGATAEQITSMQSEVNHEPWYEYLADNTPDDIRFFIANYEFDPVPFLKQVKCPFLGIWGELDTYVPVKKSVELTRQALLEAGNNDVDLVVLPQTNHRMRLTKTGSPKESGNEFTPRLWSTLTDWLVRTVGR